MKIDVQVIMNYEGFEKFAKKCREYALISVDYDNIISSITDNSYESKLDDIINDLNEKIFWQTDFFKQIKNSNEFGSLTLKDSKLFDSLEYMETQKEKLERIRNCINMYEEASRTVDFIIDDPVLLNLLARQKIQKNITEGQLTIKILKKRLEITLSIIEREQKILQDSKIISSLLDKKLEKLEKKNQRSSQEILNECYMGVKEAERLVNKFMRELVRFIDEELGDVLLAEQSGTVIRYADSSEKKNVKPVVESGQTMLDKYISVEQKDKTFLCNATKELLENLMNQSVLPDADPYITVEDSVIGRILLRSGLVMLHDKDATKMRLVEFHREIDELSFI
ncbi:hypothetical protein PCK1_001368 [Pneumocystis canis]|nr:hypothetical protein PCK1_001368 [Pneumocystis canis]